MLAKSVQRKQYNTLRKRMPNKAKYRKNGDRDEGKKNVFYEGKNI